MRWFFILFLIPSISHAYLSFGDASDGDCNWTSDRVLTKAIYNCGEFSITNNAQITVNASVTDPIQIRVQGNASIDGDIIVSANGRIAGPGGTNGGDCAATQCNSIDGTGSGGGSGGTQGNDDGTTLSNSGGGGGGGALTSTGAGAGGNGSTAGLGTPGTGGSVGSGSSTASDLDSSLLGGFGGGAGGSGEVTTNSFNAGGDGGGGAGGLLIIVKGSLSIESQTLLEAKGAQGDLGDGTGDGSGGIGGSGSGGVIYLISNTSINVNSSAVVDISGGAQRTDASAGNGGAGSVGLFRIDSPDGTITGSFGGASPTPTQNTTSTSITDPLPNYGEESSSSAEFISDIEASCTYKEDHGLLVQTLMMFLLVLGLFQAYKLRW